MREDFDSVVADRFKVLDDVPVPDTWSRVQFKVLDHMPNPDTRSPVQFTEEVVNMIDVETTDPTEPRQKRPTRVLVAGILAAAAVVGVVFVVIRDADDVTPADEPSTTVTVPPTTPPRALLSQPFEPHTTEFIALAPGTYFVDDIDGTPTARILVTIGDGWSNLSYNARVLRKIGKNCCDVTGSIAFSRPVRVFSDACHWSDGYYPGPVATVDGLVTALSEQRGWADVTAPSDISVDGYAGKAFQRTAPAVTSDCSTMGYNPRRRPVNWHGVEPLPAFRSWENEDDDRFVHPGTGPDQLGSWSFYEAGEIETLWVLDVDGTVVVINTTLFPGPSAADRAEFAAVLDSIRIERE